MLAIKSPTATEFGVQSSLSRWHALRTSSLDLDLLLKLMEIVLTVMLHPTKACNTTLLL